MTTNVDARSLNRRIKSWPAWLLLAFVVILLMGVGVRRESDPATPQERVTAISRQLACPTCDGESVAESRGTASQSIRQEIARLVGEGRLSDSDIVREIDDKFSEELRLTPGTSGVESLIWAFPIAVALTAVIGLIVAFRRWKSIEDRLAGDEDRVLVAKALAESERTADAHS
ncbi:MAG: cytochrome c-type biogenesis protein CcmH [Actinomycetota bacterium]